jgi:hypothetical protein
MQYTTMRALWIVPCLLQIVLSRQYKGFPYCDYHEAIIHNHKSQYNMIKINYDAQKNSHKQHIMLLTWPTNLPRRLTKIKKEGIALGIFKASLLKSDSILDLIEY